MIQQRVLSIIVLFVAVLILLTASHGQSRGTSRTKVESSAASVPLQARSPLDALTPTSRTADAQHTSISIRPQAESAAISMTSSPIIFFLFPTVLYELGANSPSWVGMGDVNGDGKLDLVVVGNSNLWGGDGLVGVLLGNGDGTFGTVVNYASGGHYAESGAIADVNGDGHLDIIVANLCVTYPFCPTGGLGVLLGKGDGTFAPVMTYSPGGVNTWSIAIDDLNHDGKLDIVAANCSANCQRNGSLGVLLGNGDGTFQPAVTYDPSFTPVSVAIGDVNGDNNPDLVSGGVCSSRACGSLVSVLLGNGDGTFRPAVTYNSGETYESRVEIADVNGDSLPDLLITNTYTPFGVMFGNGDGTFRRVRSYTVSGFTAALFDVNGDRKPDLLVGGVGLNLLLGNGDGTFKPPVLYTGGWSGSSAIGDVNGDGRPDLVVTSYDNVTSGVGVLLNNNGAPPTTTSLVSSANPVTVNQMVTYTATVKPQLGGIVNGKVLFQGASAPQYYPYTIREVPLEDNQAQITLSYSSPLASSLMITALYSGDLDNAAGSVSNTLAETIRGTSKTTMTTSGSPSSLGQPVTFRAKVTSQYGTIPDGELVGFYDGASAIGTGSITGGVAWFGTSSLAPGGHIITAAYVGDSTFSPSSGTIWQVVNKYPTSTTLSSSLNPSTYGQSVTWTATVTGTGSVKPTGTVGFTWGHFIGSGTLDANGVATLTRSDLNADPYPLTAVYFGDAYNARSTSPTLNQTVVQTTSKATITTSANPSKVGQAITFTAKITSPTVLPRGPVTFTAGTATIGTAQLNGGKAVLTTAALPAGSSIVKVTYNGNSNINGSSASVTQVVQP